MANMCNKLGPRHTMALPVKAGFVSPEAIVQRANPFAHRIQEMLGCQGGAMLTESCEAMAAISWR